MTGRLSPADRARLEALAAVLAPGSETMPGAAGIALTREGGLIDRVLALRPDLWGPLQEALDATVDAVSPQHLAAERPRAFSALLQVVLGAYTLDPAVKRSLRYDGQRGLTLPRGGFGGEDLLLVMMESPPRFRDPKAELVRRAARPLTAEALP